MVMPRVEVDGARLSFPEESVVNFNKFKTKKLFSKIRGMGFSLLSTGVARNIAKAPLTILDASAGELDLKDPAILLSLDVIGQAKGVLYLSFNYQREEILAKMVMALSGVTENMVKKGAFLDGAQDAFERACSIIYHSSVHVAEGDVSSNFWINVQELKDKGAVDLVIIDDLYSFSSKITRNHGGYQDILEHFNEMAVNVGIPVVLVSRS